MNNAEYLPSKSITLEEKEYIMKGDHSYLELPHFSWGRKEVVVIMHRFCSKTLGRFSAIFMPQAPKTLKEILVLFLAAEIS